MTISTARTIDATGETIEGATLKAKTVEVDGPLVDAVRELAYNDGRVLERDGLLIASLGSAIRIVLDAGLDATQAISHILGSIAEISTNFSAAPIAIGALPFDLGDPCEFIIGQITVVRVVGQQPLMIYVGTTDELFRLTERDLLDEAQQVKTRRQPAPPDHFSLDAQIPHEKFKKLVADAVAAIHASELEKVVLAREVIISANRPFHQADLLRRLRALHPSCLSFAIDGFIGATPELLIRKMGAHATSIPLAGTIARSGDPEEDARLSKALLQSGKERSEHQFVVDAIATRLRIHASEIDIPETPHMLELRNVVHLATTIEASLGDSSPSVLELACELHPTPAVCGTPMLAARAYINAHEGLSRDRYAGLVGYIDAKGDGEWWLGIRSAIIRGTTARLFAGVGIVRDSDPALELAETQLKLQALLAVLVRP